MTKLWVIPKVNESASRNKERTMTVMIGPTEAKAVKPNESSPLLPPLAVEAAKPAPKARMNGTVTGPVVTPPESKQIGRNFGLTIPASMNTKP